MVTVAGQSSERRSMCFLASEDGYHVQCTPDHCKSPVGGRRQCDRSGFSVFMRAGDNATALAAGCTNNGTLFVGVAPQSCIPQRSAHALSKCSK